MDHVQNFKSIRERKQKVLGIYSFTEPIVPETSKVVTASSANKNSQPKTRRDITLKAQRNHRQRSRDYIIALETEVERLRDGEARLSQKSTDWKRCAIALIGPSRDKPFQDRWLGQIGPGIFIWAITDNHVDHTSFKHLSLLTLPLEAEVCLGVAAVPPPLEIYDATARELLSNFCENICPSLDLTESISHGYAKHIIPLAMESDMVRNALLAASASQMKGAQGAMRFKSLVYRSAAIRGLQKTSKELQTDPKSALFTLATILGLLVDDMINENKDFPALVSLADSCTAMNPFGNDQSNNPLHLFLLDQIQMIKALVHPLYAFSQAYDPSKRSFGQTGLFPRVQLKMCDIFASIEGAMAQACSIYNLRPSLNPHETILGSSTYSSEIDILLDSLRSTVNGVPPFALGENTLVWVYSVAASRSTRPEHCAFFTSRLAELLRRIGHQDISGYLAALSISQNS